MTTENTPTRWERVRQILDAAAGPSASDYGGVGRPWRLPLARLETVEVYGVRMIAAPQEAPAAAKGCGCGCGCTATAERPEGAEPGARFPAFPGRGAASGLVRGLRGQAPYDGSVFPRLPWGGAAVADDDVQFISDWIDDGLPGDDVETALPAEPQTAEAAGSTVLDGGRVEAVVTRVFTPGGEARRGRSELRQRVNLDCMLPDQVDELRHAFRELYALNKWPADRRSYNNIALVHQDHCQHGWERFLPWHRIYLYEFEQALQDVAPGVCLPYWDFTMPQYRPECPELGLIIPLAFQAFLTEASVAWLEHGADPALPPEVAGQVRKMVGKHYPSLHRFFTAMTKEYGVPAQYTQGDHRKRFIDALLGENSLWYPLRYPAEYQVNGKPVTINQAVHYHYPTAQDMAEILALRTFRDFGGGSLYNDSFGFLDQNPHNTMHLWTGGMNPDYRKPSAPDTGVTTLGGGAGSTRNRAVRVVGRRFHTREDMYVQQQNGDMFSNLTASYDPVFWPIHVNIDRVWWEWQQLNPGGVPADLDSVLTPWSYTIADTLDITRFGYEYVKSTCLIPVGTEVPVGRFVSRPVGVPEPVRAGFRIAEVRLHRVPQLDRSCFVRVFLNLPDANADTPIDHPNYAGYLAVFGHGECIGGPGHCGVQERRPFDLRPRSHNTPRNHRVNVTRTARRLLEEGAGSLQITLVTIGADYCQDNELLRLEGVSLNFLD
ncbi:MAG TPA: tyrosinase family protein [Longimicrobium sp.]|nr:tyrosinase family protein [Longimicrobium sp.]